MTNEEKIIEEFKKKFEDTNYNFIEEDVDKPWDTEVIVDWLRQTLTTYRAQVLEEAIQLLTTHDEHDESRSECDADGLYCRSGCVYDAQKRIENLIHPTN